MINLIDELNKAKEIAIISHMRPDGDTLGGALSIFHLIKSLGKTAYLLCEDTPADVYKFLDGISEYMQSCPLKKVDLCIAIDSASKGRLGKFAKLFDKSEKTINIDHHISNNGYADINHVCLDSASTCQILFDLYKDEGASINEAMYKCLYTGISTDTGHFLHSNVTEKTFLQAAEIVANVDVTNIVQSLYKEFSKKRTLLIAKAIDNMRWFCDDKICVITLTVDELEKLGCGLDQTEGLVSYAINTKGVIVGALITQTDDKSYKISLRSKNGFNVDQCAQDFGGGGHILAAGCMLFGSLDSVVNKIVKSVESRM